AFFFQAEDGIRDRTVTGVQTCALPISWIVPLLVFVALAIGVLAIRGGLKPVREVSELAAAIGPNATSIRLPEQHLPSEITPLVRSEERRVGKECRERGGAEYDMYSKHV